MCAGNHAKEYFLICMHNRMNRAQIKMNSICIVTQRDVKCVINYRKVNIIDAQQEWSQLFLIILCVSARRSTISSTNAYFRQQFKGFD